MRMRATVVSVDGTTVWLEPERLHVSCAGCTSCAGCSSCPGGDGKTRRTFPAENPLNLPLRKGMTVHVSAPASRTAAQFLLAVALPSAAAVSAYILAPAGKAGGIKIAAALAVFAAVSGTVTAISAVRAGPRKKKDAGQNGRRRSLQITGIL